MSDTDHRDSAARTARDRAAWRVREHVRDTAVGAFGATDTTSPSCPPNRPSLDDPLAGVRAARLISDVAAGQLREWALRARGAGRTWDDVAEALGLDDRDGEAAWEWLVEHRPPAPDPRAWSARPESAVWMCTTCRTRVRDSGPYASHPGDRETGHADGCTRHGVAVADWRRSAGLAEGDREEDR